MERREGERCASLTASRIAARGGRVTRARLAVLAVLEEASEAMRHELIEQALVTRGVVCDRVTLYRTLDWLVLNGLAHRVHGADRAWRFAALQQVDEVPHAHFHCEGCGQVVCLQQQIPALSLPSGYRLKRAELNLFGACPACEAHA